MKTKKTKSSVVVKPREPRPSRRSFTIRDVAKRASVSAATVSRVINKPECVEETKRTRVLKVMRQMDFTPNQIAASLAKSKSECIGLIVPNLSPVFAPLVDEIEKVINAQGSYVMVITGKTRAEDVAESVRFLQQRRCDAIIVFPGMMNDIQVKELLDTERNVILLQRTVAGYEHRCVQADNRIGAYLATRYLIDSGHRDIAVITGPRYNQESNIRYDSFVKTMKEAGLPVDSKLVASGDFDIVSGENAIAQLLATDHPFTGLFCFSDEMAFGAMSYLCLIGASLPDEMSVVGFDDILYGRHAYPRLTTVHQPLVEIGRIAAQRALALRSGGSDTEWLTSLVPPNPRLVIRNSVVSTRHVRANLSASAEIA